MRTPRRNVTGRRPEPGGRRPRRRRILRWAGALVVLLASATALAGFLAVADDGAGELSEAQWQRLLSKMSGRAAPAAAAASPPAAGTAVNGDRPGERAPGDGPIAPPQPPQLVARRLPVAELEPEVRSRQADEYAAGRDKTVIELQQFRSASSTASSDGADRRGTATLINLNPRINSWYLLRIAWEGEPNARDYHLTNVDPAAQTLILQHDYPTGIGLATTAGATRCDLWSHDNPRRLEAAVARNTPYVMLCDERVLLRIETTGRRTTVEKVTDFLRDSVWGGEAITVFVREKFFQDAFLSTADLSGPATTDEVQQSVGAPLAARLDPQAAGRRLERTDLGLSLEGVPRGGQSIGVWYPLRGNPRAFASTMQPSVAAPDILASHTDVVVRLDEVEAAALSYLVAFDLDAFDVAFSVGTDHPRLGWSERVPEERREAGLSGPDGIASRAPLVATGIIPGGLAARSVATFTGGFKRSHGAFRYGELAMVNHGSHYGLIEEGVLLSKLQPGLATIYVLGDGTFAMKTWDADDDQLLDRIRYARQNGVPIIERGDDPRAPGVPGSMVSRYGPGNWSGSQEGKYRTLRAGACLQHAGDHSFLIYAYFSSATPSAMARVFQAYGCTYALLLDMNALEHTYMATYAVRGDELAVEHLVQGMEVLDKTEGGRLLPRFLGFADNRDFFYLLRHETPPPTVVEAGS